MYEEFIASPVFSKKEAVWVHLSGISHRDDTHLVHRRNSSTAYLGYVLSGSGTFLRNKELTASAGDSFCVPIGETYKYYPNKNDPWSTLWILIGGALVTPMIDAYRLSAQTVYHCNTEKYFLQMHEILSSKSLTSHEMSLQLASVFHSLIIFLSENREKKSDIPADAQAVREYINKNIYSKLNLDDLNSVTFKSKEHMIRIFKKAYGVTPYEYYNSRRIEKAKDMLQDTSLSVKEIAYTLNFSDEHYFSGFFKSKTGASPTEYRYKETKSSQK